MNISYKVKVNIVPLKDYFLPLYGFCPIWRSLLLKISLAE